MFVNRCGIDDGVRFWGGSRVLGPTGAVGARLGDEPATARVELDLGALRTLRADVPILREDDPALVASLLAGGTSAPLQVPVVGHDVLRADEDDDGLGLALV